MHVPGENLPAHIAAAINFNAAQLVTKIFFQQVEPHVHAIGQVTAREHAWKLRINAQIGKTTLVLAAVKVMPKRFGRHPNNQQFFWTENPFVSR